MSYFSFTLRKSIFDECFLNDAKLSEALKAVQPKLKYYSKYPRIIKAFKNNLKTLSIISLNREEIKDSIFLGENTIFFLPPQYGLGDIIEYGLAIKQIQKKFPNKKIALGFVYQYKKILEEVINLQNLYEYYICQEELESYKSHFHLTYGIEDLKFQKYKREDIKKIFLSKLKIENKNNLKHSTKMYKKIRKISIFPFSASPLRTLPLKTIIDLIEAFSDKLHIEIIMDNFSPYLNLFVKLNLYNNVKLLFPEDPSQLLKIIKKTEFGIFPDSGPLHLAKLLNVNGVLIENSVPSSKLIAGNLSIKTFKNKYKSTYCKGPCGLTNIINYNNSYGCYESLKIDFNKIKNLNNLKSLQRGSIKKKYEFFINNPVNCMKNINNKLLIDFIKKQLPKISKEKIY